MIVTVFIQARNLTPVPFPVLANLFMEHKRIDPTDAKTVIIYCAPVLLKKDTVTILLAP